MSWLRPVAPNPTTSFPRVGGSAFFSGKRLTWREQSSSSTFHLKLPIKDYEIAQESGPLFFAQRPFFLFALALISGVAFLASSSDSNPSTAENFFPIA